MSVEEIKIELTNYCKRGCIHCSSDANTHGLIELDIDKVYDIVDQAKMMGIKSIVLTGGEVTEYKSIEDLVKYISEKGFAEIKLYTMCEPTMPKFNLIKKLKEAGLTEVVYSLTVGLTTDNVVRFDNILEFLKEISNILKVSFHYCLTTKTVDDLNVLESIISELNQDNFECLSFLRYVEHGRGTDELTLSSGDLKRLKPTILKLFQKYPNKIHLGSPFNILNITYTPCTAGEKTMIIGFDGSVYPCDAMKYFNYLGSGGNIFDHTLIDIYNSAYFKEIRKYANVMNEECINCSNELCQGGCLGQKMINMLKRNNSSITTTWYQENALRTINNFENHEVLKLNAYAGIIGEYGEFFDYIKKLYTHSLDDEKKKEILALAPNELGDLVWYLVTSLALVFDYTLDDIYSCIINDSKKTHRIDENLIATAALSKDPLCENTNNNYSYDIDLINEYLEDYQGDDILFILMDFKRTLNKIDEIDGRETAIKTVSAVLLKIAGLAKFLFGLNLSEILVNNIEKLRKRYPEGFDTNTANRRIDANKVYKAEEDLKARNLVPKS